MGAGDRRFESYQPDQGKDSMGRQKARKKIRKQHCAYCARDITVSKKGRLMNHYNEVILCVGTGFVADKMATLVHNIEEDKREALGSR